MAVKIRVVAKFCFFFCFVRIDLQMLFTHWKYNANFNGEQLVSTYLLIYLFFHSFYESVDGIVYSNRSCVQQHIIFSSLLLFFFLQSFSSLFSLKLASFFRSSKVYSFKFNFSFEFLIFLIFLCRILWVSHSRHQITTTLKHIFFSVHVATLNDNADGKCWWWRWWWQLKHSVSILTFKLFSW